MANLTGQIADLFVKHDINLLRVQAGIRKDIFKLLNGMNKEVLDALTKIDPSAPAAFAFRNRRMNTLVSISNDVTGRYFTAIKGRMETNGKKLAGLEAQNAVQTTNSVLNVDLLTKTLNEETLTALAKDVLIEGAPSAAWWSGQKKRYVTNFKRILNEGIVAGDPIPAMSRRVRDLLKTTKRQADALVRSSAQAVVQEARFKTYQANSDVIKGQQWLAVLDNRTTPICQALDGQAWLLNGRKMEGTTAAWRGPPPAHWNCRSTLVPVMKSFSEMSSEPKNKKRLDRLEGKNKKKLQGAADGKPTGRMTYEQWLKKQSPERQLEVLGPTKLKLWKSGKINMTDLIDQGHNPLTITQLEQKVARRKNK